MIRFLYRVALFLSVAALVLCTLERRGRSRIPLIDLIKDRFPKPESPGVAVLLGFMAGTTVVVGPLVAGALLGWIRWDVAGGFSLSFLVMGFLSVLIKIVWAGLEEIIFRGAVLPQLAKRTNVMIGLLVSSLIFALAHVGRNPLTLGIYLVDGLGFGIAYLATRSLWISAIWHTTKNLWVWLLFSRSTIQFTHGLTRIEVVGPKLWSGTGWQADWLDLMVGIVSILVVTVGWLLGRNNLNANRQWIRCQ